MRYAIYVYEALYPPYMRELYEKIADNAIII